MVIMGVVVIIGSIVIVIAFKAIWSKMSTLARGADGGGSSSSGGGGSSSYDTTAGQGEEHNTCHHCPHKACFTSDCVRCTRMSSSHAARKTAPPIAAVAVAAAAGGAEGDIVCISGGHCRAPVECGSLAAGADANTFASTSW